MIVKHFKGVFFAIFAAISYGLNPFFGMPLYAEGLDPYSVLVYRFGFAAILMAPVIPLNKSSFKLPVKYMLPTALAGFFMAMTCLLWFASFRIMDTGIAATLLFVYPVMVALIMWGFFHEKMNKTTLTGIIIALCGVVILCRTEDGNVPLNGVIMIMFSALAYALYIVLVKVSSLKDFSPYTLTFYAMIIAVVIFLIPLRMGLDMLPITSWRGFGNAIGLAIFPSLCAFLFTAMAVKHIGATQTAILGAVEPVTAVSVGIFIFGEPFSLKIALGILTIIFAVVIVICGTASKSQTTSDPAL